MANFVAMGFGGGTAIGSSFGGQTYAGYNNSVVNNFNSSSNPSNSTSPVSPINPVGQLSYSNGWTNTANGL